MISWQSTTFLMEQNRVVFLDYLRVLACLLVILVHACEFFYVGESGISIRNDVDRFWVSLIDSACRAAVPLFVMTSAYLLLPIKGSGFTFLKRRLLRVAVPFIIWSILYATVPVLYGEMTVTEMMGKLTRLLWNFNYSSGHLWFIYMLIGLYLIMPVISPWLKQVSKRGEQTFIAVWFLTTFYHYFKGHLEYMYGECPWNEFHTFWYYSGYIGYLVLAHYIRTYINWSLTKSLIVGVITFCIGYYFTYSIFYDRSLISTDYYFVEVSWRFCTFNVALMTFGIFIMMKKINYDKKWLYRIIGSISRLSYGMYLMHIFFLNFYFQMMHEHFSTPIIILLVSGATFVTSYVVAKGLSYLPGSRYYVG